MTIPFYCVFFAMLMLLITKMPVAYAMFKMGGYDNHHPREQQSKLKGWGNRALAAHKNELEAFPIFIAGVFIAHLGHGDPLWAARLSVAFVCSRFLYMLFYILDLDIIRSTVWSVGYGTSLLLALLPLF
jgi:uncharacterized MAPEG superfamily protein